MSNRWNLEKVEGETMMFNFVPDYAKMHKHITETVSKITYALVAREEKLILQNMETNALVKLKESIDTELEARK